MAESVKEQTKDAYSKDEINPFDQLKQEIYDGIIETWDSEYNNGLERMNKVLSQSVDIKLDACRLVKETDYVTIKAKKGVCHHLVNEDKIKGWVKQ